MGQARPDQASPEGLPFRVPTSQQNVLQYGQAGPLSRRLERANQAEAGDAMRRQALDGSAFKEHGPRVGELETRNEIYSGTLACPVGADQPGHLALRSAEGTAIHSDDTAEMLVELFYHEGCLDGFRRSSPVPGKRLAYRGCDYRLWNRRRRVGVGSNLWIRKRRRSRSTSPTMISRRAETLVECAETASKQRITSCINTPMERTVDVAALWQQPLWPEADEQDKDGADRDIAQGRGDVGVSKNVWEVARRFLDQDDHDDNTQDDALDISSSPNQDSRVQNDGFNGRPGRWIEGAQVGGEETTGQAAERGSEDIGL